MPAPAVARAKLTFSGVVGPTPWATSVWFSRDSDLVPAPTNIADALTAYRAFAAATSLNDGFIAFNATSTLLNQMRLDYYVPSSNASAASGTIAVSAVAGSVTSSSPASTCVVATLLSATTGKSGRGRMYWPATADMGSSHLYTFLTSLCSTFCASLADFLGDVNGAAAFGDAGTLTAVVSSQGGLKPVVRPPAVHPIVNVRVDNIPDRQEHREKNITPSVSLAAV